MDTANSFVMSSYQFVNSLAQCYPQSQLNQAAATNNNNNNNNVTSANPNAPNDYFPSSAYNPNLYPGASQNHYSGPQNYGNLSTQQGQTDMVDYTQLQPHKFLLNQQQQQQSSQAPVVGQPPSTAQVNSQSCKYANDSVSSAGTGNSTSISSPQDLSTAREISPKLSPNSVVENVTRNLNKAGTVGVNSNSSSNNPNNVSLRSPEPDDSDASSDSGNEGGGGGSSQSTSGKKGNPPHIYPWMKRVHIGQSK